MNFINLSSVLLLWMWTSTSVGPWKMNFYSQCLRCCTSVGQSCDNVFIIDLGWERSHGRGGEKKKARAHLTGSVSSSQDSARPCSHQAAKPWVVHPGAPWRQVTIKILQTVVADRNILIKTVESTKKYCKKALTLWGRWIGRCNDKKQRQIMPEAH